MTRTHMIVLAASALSILMLHANAYAAEPRIPAGISAAATCKCDAADVDATRCKGRITNADGEDGKDNASPDSGNGGKGGTIRNAGKCDSASANGGKGGSGNRGAKSGNGGKGGHISF